MAIGDNIDMGGQNKSSIHFDMVSLKPEVEVDGLSILSGGQLSIRSQDWREDYRELALPPELDLRTFVRLSAIDTEVDSKSLLRRIWHTGSGRVCSVPVGDDESAKLARTLYKRLERNGKEEPILRITRYFPGLSAEDVMKLVSLLQRYNLVSIGGQQTTNGNGGE